MGFKNEELIKEKIMDGCRRGVCNSEGDSIMVDGRQKAKPRKMRPTLVYKEGKWSNVG